MKKCRADRWREVPVDTELSSRIERELRCSRILAEVLVRRGVESPEAAARFLNPALADLADPALLPGIDAAVARIKRAVGEREKITVYGDYDVDGVSSTALLLEFFAFIGYPVSHSIPRRIEEGFGMNCARVRRIAEDGTRLIITVDNGSSARQEIDLARSLGVDVVVTDHHVPSDPPPTPNVLVNPWLPGSRYPFPQLAGVGVVFKVIWAICRAFSRSRKVSPEFRKFLRDALGLVALGTIADVVPLRGENRILAFHGLRALSKSSRPGLRALVNKAVRSPRGREDGPEDRTLDAEDVAFRIGPCLNSAGRLGDADLALRLLITPDETEGEALAAKLVKHNATRRQIEKKIHTEAKAKLLESVNLDADRAVVLAGQDWHRGVIGIVASRLVDEFFRPTLLISLDGETGRGSARSIPQVRIRDVLAEASSCLDSFGGHAQAAGVTVAASRIDELRERMNRAIDIAPADMVRELEHDGEYEPGVWTAHVIRELGRLAPFGQGNREPLFVSRDLEVVGAPRLLGKDGAHLSFLVRQKERVGPLRFHRDEGKGGGAVKKSVRSVAFGMGERHPEIACPGARVSMVYRPVLNCWRNEARVEVHVRQVDVRQARVVAGR